MEKLFLVDWGEKTNGARYAIIKSTEEMIGLNLDSIGNPSDSKYAEIDNGDYERFYIELPHIKIESQQAEGGTYTNILSAGTYTNRFNTNLELEWKNVEESS